MSIKNIKVYFFITCTTWINFKNILNILLQGVYFLIYCGIMYLERKIHKGKEVIKMKGCKVLNQEEITKIMNGLGNIRDRALIMTGLHFGTRISESLNFRFKNFEGNEVYIDSKKGSEKVSFPISAQYKQVINELREYYVSQGKEVTPDTYLFLSRKGNNQPITRQQASQIIRATCEAIGLTGKINTHSFRKSFVTKIYEITKFNIIEVKKYSRHKNLSNLDYYIGTTEERNLTANLTW